MPSLFRFCSGARSLGIFIPLPEKRRWIALMVIGYILTLGPYLKWTDPEPFRIALPYLWFYNTPFFERGTF